MQFVCGLQVGELLEQYLGSCRLTIIPFGLVLQYDMTASSHDLGHCLSVCHHPWNPRPCFSLFLFGLFLPAFFPMLLYGPVLAVEDFPSVPDPQLATGLG